MHSSQNEQNADLLADQIYVAQEVAFYHAAP